MSPRSRFLSGSRARPRRPTFQLRIEGLETRQLLAASPLATGASPIFVVNEPPGQATTQNLGVLFPHEWRAGITVVRDATGGSDPTSPRLEDVYDFQVLQDQTYTFTLQGDSLPDGIQITLTDDTGSPISTSGIGGGQLVQVDLQPGSYVLQVGGWDPSLASTVAYQVKLAIIGGFANPPPLSCVPAPTYLLATGKVIDVGSASRTAPIGPPHPSGGPAPTFEM